MATSALDALRVIHRELNAARAEAVPTGWLTVQQLAAAGGIGISQTGAKMRAALVAGIVEKRMFRINQGPFVRPTAHYRMKVK